MEWRIESGKVIKNSGVFRMISWMSAHVITFWVLAMCTVVQVENCTLPANLSSNFNEFVASKYFSFI